MKNLCSSILTVRLAVLAGALLLSCVAMAETWVVVEMKSGTKNVFLVEENVRVSVADGLLTVEGTLHREGEKSERKERIEAQYPVERVKRYYTMESEGGLNAIEGVETTVVDFRAVATGEFQITGLPEGETVSVFTTTGILCKRQSAETVTRVALQALGPGTYIIHSKTLGGVTVVR